MKYWSTLFLASIICAGAQAATENNLFEKIESIQQSRSTHYSWDFNINSFSNNYGLGLGVGTPYYFGGGVNFRVSGAYAWVQGVSKGEASQSWSPYGILRAGVYGSGFVLGTVIRGYGGGGPLLLIPSSGLSDEGSQVGGFGLAGLEFPLSDRGGAVYMELGGMGTGATAEKLREDPIYANGFLASWGFRYLL